MSDPERIPPPPGGNLLAIDPGSQRSAWVGFRDGQAQTWGIDPNARMGSRIAAALAYEMMIAVEYPYPRGQMMTYEIVQTIEAIGRMTASVMESELIRVNRDDVKLYLLNQRRGTDSQIRSAIVELWGGKDLAIGKKASPGRFYGMKADMWQALAAGLTVLAGHAYIPRHVVSRRGSHK